MVIYPGWSWILLAYDLKYDLFLLMDSSFFFPR